MYLGELGRIRDGVTREEFERAMVGLKASLVMQGASSSARASSLAADQFTFGRPRTLEQRRETLEAVTHDAVNAYLADHPVNAVTVATTGAQPLTVHQPNVVPHES